MRNCMYIWKFIKVLFAHKNKGITLLLPLISFHLSSLKLGDQPLYAYRRDITVRSIHRLMTTDYSDKDTRSDELAVVMSSVYKLLDGGLK